jgi:hypothetical protein
MAALATNEPVFLRTLLIAAWGSLILAGTAAMVGYQMTPASTSTPTYPFPVESSLALDPTRPTLVMVLHPHCPCSRASLHELEAILAHARRPVAVHLLFYNPHDAPSHWLEGTLWRQANAIKDASVVIDRDGTAALSLGATTSGEVVVYDTQGKVLFCGGITDGRGHEGDNAGQSAVLALLQNQTPRVRRTPVYGCSLGIAATVGRLK